MKKSHYRISYWIQPVDDHWWVSGKNAPVKFSERGDKSCSSTRRCRTKKIAMRRMKSCPVGSRMTAFASCRRGLVELRSWEKVS